MNLQTTVWRSVIACACVWMTGACASNAPDPGPSPMRDVLARAPLSFESNQGQAAADVKFVSRSPGHTLMLTSDRAELQLVHEKGPAAAVSMRFGDGHQAPHIEPLDQQSGQVNYLVGNDPAQWRFDVPHYAKVRYRDVYPGVDLIFYGNQRHLEYDVVVAPGADPSSVALHFDGATNLHVDGDGDLILDTDGGRIEQGKPVIYQEKNGRKKVIAGQYVVKAGGEVAFAVGDYDATLPLVIDPSLAFFTYLGGGGDEILTMAIDTTGNVYVAGDTTATAFPTVGPFQGTLGGKHDGFITKFGPGGSPMIFSTYLGGAGDDFINGIAVGGRAGNVYVTGDTDSTNFPTFIPFQSANRGGAEAFVSELNTAGNGLVFSSYFGGAGEDRGMSIALDADSNVFFTGFTASSGNFPLMLPVQPAFGGGPYDAFLTKFNAQGTQPLFSTFLGGDGDDEAFGVAADPVSGRAIVTGATASRNFFTTPDAAQGTSRGGADIFITQFTVDGNSRPYSTLLGGAGDDFGLGIAMGPNGVFGIAGATASSDFPTVASPARFGGGAVDLVALEGSLNGTPRFPIFSAVIGGSGADVGYGVSFDPTGNALFTGGTNSTDLTLVRAIQASNAGGNDVIIVGFNPAGVVQTESYFGGPGSDLGIAAVFDPRTSVFLLSGISTTPQNQQKGFLAIYNELFPPLPPGPLRK